MNRTSRHLQYWLVAALCVVSALLSACGTPARAQDTGATNGPPSRLEPIDGSEVSRVILTDLAAKRLDIQTQPVRSEEVPGGGQRTLIPYAAVIYDLEGEAWVYTSPAPLTFVRANIDVETIDGDLAVVSSGPPAGTLVVTVGGAELYGAEFEFQEG